MSKNPFAYDTPLSADEEKAFQVWRSRLRTNLQGTQDYDLRGAWKANAKEAGNGHLPDKWKKPNHTTFSDGSMYASPENPAGSWVKGVDGSWIFFAGPNSGQYRPDSALQDYFTKYEPGNRVVLPVNPANPFAR